MTAELPDWEFDNPLEKYAPTPAEHARAGALWEQMLDDDRQFCATFEGACQDVLTERNLREFLAAVMLHGRDLVEGNCSDRKLARRRLAVGVSESREQVIKEMLLHDDDDD